MSASIVHYLGRQNLSSAGYLLTVSTGVRTWRTEPTCECEQGGAFYSDLTPAVADADAANAANAAKPATQGVVTVGDVPSATITLANPIGPNVVPVTSVRTHGVIAIVGDETASVVLNLAGE